MKLRYLSFAVATDFHFGDCCYTLSTNAILIIMLLRPTAGVKINSKDGMVKAMDIKCHSIHFVMSYFAVALSGTSELSGSSSKCLKWLLCMHVCI